MGTGESHDSFRSTHWSLIERVRRNDAEAKNELARAYLAPCAAYLRKCIGNGRNGEDAEDLAQDFFDVEKGRMWKCLLTADQTKGSFRPYLKQGLEWYAKERRPNGPQPIDPELLDARPQANGTESLIRQAEREFDRHAFASLLSRALKQVEREYSRGKYARHWKAFEARILRPNVDGCEPISMEKAVSVFDVEKPIDISSMVNTVKRRIETVCASLLMEEAGMTRAEAEAELKDLIASAFA